MMESKMVQFVADLIKTMERFDALHPIDEYGGTPSRDEYFVRDVPVFSGESSETKLGSVAYIEGGWAWVPVEEDGQW
jgi:hypothetical protein